MKELNCNEVEKVSGGCLMLIGSLIHGVCDMISSHHQGSSETNWGGNSSCTTPGMPPSNESGTPPSQQHGC